MNNTTITTMVVVFSLFLFIVLANTIVYAQQMPPPSPRSNTPTPTSPKLHAVKIISPTKGQQVPAFKDLTISGTSIDNTTSNCQVSMNVNHVKPYQSATAAGTGGANDYSKWNFVLTSNYTTIKPGPDNRITAKYSCTDNLSTVSYSSVNVTGVVVTAAAAPAANPTTAYPKQQQNMMTTTSNNTAITTSNGNTNKITAQGKPSLTMGKNNTTAILNSVSVPPPPPPSSLPPPPPPVSTPTNTQGSGKLLHLGSSESGSKSDNTKAVAHHSSRSSSSSSESGSKSDNTKAVAHHSSRSSSSESGSKSDNTKAVAHHSSSEDNSSTAKVKTQRTSSDKLSKAITTIDEHHSIKPVNSKSKTSHNNGGKSKDVGGDINSKFGDSDPLSNALDHMSDTLDHLFG